MPNTHGHWGPTAAEEAFDGLWARLRTASAFTLAADGEVYTEQSMTRTGQNEWRTEAGAERITVRLHLDPLGGLVLHAVGIRTIEEVCLLDVEFDPAPAELYNHVWMSMRGMQQSTVVFARYDDGPNGVFACYANPFAEAHIDGARLRLSYRPGLVLDDDPTAGFTSDPLIIGTTTSTGRKRRLDLVPGRDTAEGNVVNQIKSVSPSFPVVLDEGEIAAVRNATTNRIPWDEPRARVAHWDWGENLYRLDPASPEGLAAYGRMAQLCKEIGVEISVVAPAFRQDVELGVRGPWQYIMFLGRGLDVADGNVEAPPPAGHDTLLKTFEQHGVGVAVYTNPLCDWRQNPEWVHDTVGLPPDREHLPRACLGVPDAVDYFVDAVNQTGGDGVTIDFVGWWPCQAESHPHTPDAGSKYAQWAGYRRILNSLKASGYDWREALLGSQPLMPWGAKDMTHPHPVLSDNQPQWVPAWPDLSVDRANAHYQRRTAWFYRNLAFLPSYKVPGQVGHQANRRHDADVERGWDWEGARYNLLASIASAPSSTVVCFLPCWDEDEWRAMRERDGEFFRQWIDFAKDNAAVLSRLDDLFDDPRPGAVDGTIAVDDDGGGFVFLANPDYTPHEVDVPLPAGRALRELHPEPGRLWRGRVEVERNEVAVFELVSEADVPAVAASRRPTQHDGITPTLTGWDVDLAKAQGDVRATTTWVPGTALPALLQQLKPPIAPQADEHLQPWSDPSRLRLFPQILDPRHVTLNVAVDGDDVPVHQAWIGTYEDVFDQPDNRHNLLGHYIDVTEKLLAADDLERPWEIVVELRGLQRHRWMGMHIAHLPRRRREADAE